MKVNAAGGTLDVTEFWKCETVGKCLFGKGTSVSVKQSGRIGRQTFTSNCFSLRAQQPDSASDVQEFSVPRQNQLGVILVRKLEEDKTNIGKM